MVPLLQFSGVDAYTTPTESADRIQHLAALPVNCGCHLAQRCERCPRQVANLADMLTVALVLRQQFTAYSLFAFSCTRLPEGHSIMMHVLRWAAGWTLIFFNLWVKMDAHRVVKDYAW